MFIERARPSHFFRKERNAKYFALCGNDMRQSRSYKHLAAYLFATGAMIRFTSFRELIEGLLRQSLVSPIRGYITSRSRVFGQRIQQSDNKNQRGRCHNERRPYLNSECAISIKRGMLKSGVFSWKPSFFDALAARYNS